MYIIEIIPEEKRIGIKSSIDGCGVEMAPQELYDIAVAFDEGDWKMIEALCKDANSL